MNLISNTGIQYASKILEIDTNDNYKLYFCESKENDSQQLKLELAHYFSEEDVWVFKRDLSKLGYVQIRDEENDEGNIIKKGDVVKKWSDISNNFNEQDLVAIPFLDNESVDLQCFNINANKLRIEKFENKWLPMPFFMLTTKGRSRFGPTNWCRFKLQPVERKGGVFRYEIILAFDTNTKYEDESFEDEDLLETPVFSSADEDSKKFALCNDENMLVDFCSKAKKCEWVDSRILNIYHDIDRLSDIQSIRKPKLRYLSEFIFLLRYIQRLNVLPDVTLYSNQDVAYQDVDLVIDIGNSRTRAILFDDGDFTKVETLSLQNFTEPVKNGKLNIYSDPFDMRLAFREADFGGEFIRGSNQFVYPSIIRLGKEATNLIYKATYLNEGVEKITTFSSPKRYLWDDKPNYKEWRFVTLEGEESKSIWNDAISPQLNADGSLNLEGSGGVETRYSRKTLMTLCFVEILAQANMQINSYHYRKKWGLESTPRKVSNIIVTCPTAMSKVEQISLRECANDAAVILNRFYSNEHKIEIEKKKAFSKVKITPSVKNLSNIEDSKEWIYDEATCSQFVYLYAELKERYLGKTKEFFDFYGKKRNYLESYNKKSIVIGSVDIGAGTTDIMIASYQYDDHGQCELTPTPIFWESFYEAGDDLIKELIQHLIIEGEHASIYKKLRAIPNVEVSKKLLDFFGKDDARKSIEDRQIRSEFNIQVSIPVVSHLLQFLNEKKKGAIDLSFEEVFKSNQPSERVRKHFKNHFKFNIEDIVWEYNEEIISKIIERTFDSLASKISTIFSYYECDIVLLSGRPTSLRPLSDLFLKHYAVEPNRLITLNDYRIGTWFPFHDGNGYFQDAKSNVAVGAMIGDFASSRGGLNGFRLNLKTLSEQLTPTTDYFATGETADAFITPEKNYAKVEVTHLPMRIWCRQLDSKYYPTRPFYMLDYNMDYIKENILRKKHDLSKQQLKEEMDKKIAKLKIKGKYFFNIVRESYNENKETLELDSIETIEGDDLNLKDFSLQIQSMNEDENYWMDSGEFHNLAIT